MKTGRKIRFDPNLSKGSQDFVILLAFTVVRCFIWLTARLKQAQVKFLVRTLYGPVSRFNRKVCRRNLAALFPSAGQDAAQLEKLYREYLEYMVRFQVETARLFTIPPRDLENKVLLAGESHLQETLKKGTGALLISGHMGTWWHAPCFLAAKGFKVNVVFNSFPPAVENYLKRHAARHNIRLTFVDKGVPQLIRQATRQNEIVYLTFDVAVRKNHGNWLPFGNTRININPGPALLARRNQIPVHFVSTCHGDAHHTHVTIQPDTSLDIDDSETNPNSLSQQWVDKLYADILAHPEQWWGWGFSDLPLVRKRKKAPLPVPA